MSFVNAEKIAALAAIVVIGSTLFFAVHAPPSQVHGDVALPTKTNFGLVATKDQAHGTLHLKAVRAVPAGAELDIDVLDDRLSEKPEQKRAREAAGIDADYSINRALVEPSYHFPFDDLGTFAAYNPGGRSDPSSQGRTYDDSLVVGLRASPCRILYGTIAPDFLIGAHEVGLGASFYAPVDYFGHQFVHWGLGVGRLWSLDQGRPGNVIYLSFSTHD